MKTSIVSIIVSVDDENGIGVGGKIPWYIPEDFKWFKEKTMGHTVLMGSKTFESIIERLGKPLPGRINVVITKQKDLNYKDVFTADSIEKGIEAARQKRKKWRNIYYRRGTNL